MCADVVVIEVAPTDEIVGPLDPPPPPPVLSILSV
jgi:hypothetical protein